MINTITQLIRSAVQWLAGAIIALAIVDIAVAALGLDPDTVHQSLTTVLELLVFLAYIGLVRLLERIDPRFGWLNGWRAELDYDTDVTPLR